MYTSCMKYLIIGLGNPGSRFVQTRHNLGQLAVEEWCRRTAGDEEVSWREEKSLYKHCQTAYSTCLIPLTFMNESGQAVHSFLQAHRGEDYKLLIVHDDVELPFGDSKFSEGGSAKGHNGVRSIQSALGTLDIPRLRLGIGRPLPEMPLEDFVLSPFDKAEQEQLPAFTERAAQLLTEIVTAA